jgi:hypothetical protein
MTRRTKDGAMAGLHESLEKVLRPTRVKLLR